MRWLRATAAVLATAAGSTGLAAAADRHLANGCFALRSAANGRYVSIGTDTAYRADARGAKRAAAFYLKPTALGKYMLQDPGRLLLAVGSGAAVTRTGEAGKPAEWAIHGARPAGFTVASTEDRRQLAVDHSTGDLVLRAGHARSSGRRFRLAPDRGCRRFPEARVGARGPTFKGTNADGTVFGFIDDHLHITANMRAGGSTIYGEPFDRFGIAAALGHDADVHGPDGSLDVTGNLLRTGSPAGTHDTHGWPTFTGWPVHDTYTHQQTYYVWLERAWKAGMRLVVAQTVEDQPLCMLEQLRSHSCNEMHTVKLEIRRLRAMQRYIDAQSGGRGQGWFRIVTSPDQARRVIERGKLAVVLGMETSDPLGCSEFEGVPQCTKAEIDHRLDTLHRMGLRSMFITHWVDNAFGGAALEPGANGQFISLMQQEQTGQPFQTAPCRGRADEADGQCNTLGLTSLGRYLVHELMAKHMLIEADHLSQKARKPVMRIAAANRYPLISSHTGTGGDWTPGQLRRLYALGGMASATLDQAPKLAAKIARLRRFRSRDHYFGVGLGSDTGGFNALPGPRPDAASDPLHYPFKSYDGKVAFRRQRTGQRVFDLNTDGVAQYGLVPDLLADTERQKHGATALRVLFRSAEAYLEMWGRAYARP